ncbi:SCO family protein [Sphingobacterium psychroaquaticum]|uniref:SCO family protein n=1 Tax=Sphingobacterium psychroaquaticum TaxID=561061 RepID=UPI00106C8BF8|nr:SCO family protein [Sphingobacterium psychroaquaticum]QBQ40751.1 SCO family protein [Sphingobacterium psychroaquaticum]
MKIAIKQSLLSLFFFAAIVGCAPKADKKLPYIGEPDIEEKIVDGKTITDTIYHRIPSFSFLNQDSVLLTEKAFDNKVYIANFFFTHCPSICPTMQRNLLKVYEKYKGDDRVSFLSHSIDFKFDSPSVLKAYAQKLGVTNEQWQFVTGSKKDIYGLADQYLVYTKEDASVPGGYDHQGYLVLVDKDKHIRGAYDGTNEEQVAQLFTDLEILLQEK